MTGVHTIRSIARQTGESPATIHYLTKSRGIRPAGRVGIARIFDDGAVAMITNELKTLRKNRRFLLDV